MQLAVGWDVGGWRGKNQAIAVLKNNGDGWSWAGCPSSFSLRDTTMGVGRLDDFVRVGFPDASIDVLDQYNITIAIDAPLRFPVAFRQLLAGEAIRPSVDGSHIDNPLAFRLTDRWVHGTFGKLPLSASFDKLGNNATVAMSYTAMWEMTHELSVWPFDARSDVRHIAIEVYPALVKARRSNECIASFREFMPDSVAPGTHAYDAAICAVLASAARTPRRHSTSSPMELVGPPGDVDLSIVASEGWIYAPSCAWLEG
jgi:hypothetical protein